MKTEAKVLLLSCILSCALWPRCNAQLTLQVTVRDFLPLACINATQFSALGITDSVLTELNYDATPFSATCPYAAFIDSGDISGHPDFMRQHTAGWNMGFLFDVEDAFGVNSFLSGTCDAAELQGDPRPPNLPFTVGRCQSRYQPYSQRLNLTKMDMSASGLPKPQYCTSDPNGRCGFYLDFSSQPVYQSANKFFQDMWYEDDAKYNKRIGTTLEMSEVSPGVFEFDSRSDSENALSPSDGFFAPHASFLFDEALNPDPFQVKAWPLTGSSFGDLKSSRKFLYTSEIHTFFHFQGTEVFTFSGDDDLWLYINGRVALNLGGLHATATQSIDLSNPLAMSFLGITVGGVYTLDIFHAERMPSGSNYVLSLPLSSPCNILVAGVQLFPSPSGNSFVKDSTVVFPFVNGNVYSGETIQLLPSGTTSASTYIFEQEQIGVSNGFVVDFTFSATGMPDGFTFLLHDRQDGLSSFPSSTGSDLGFQGVEKSVAIAFDLCTDRAIPGNQCKGQEVSIYYAENVGDVNEATVVNRRVHAPILLSLKNGEDHVVKIQYFFNPSALEVTIDDSLYLREMPFNPSSILNSSAAYMGFTGAVSANPGGINIDSWSVNGIVVDSAGTVGVDFDAAAQTVTSPKTLVADNIETTGYSIQSRDTCGFDIKFGGESSNMVGKFVERKDGNGVFANSRSTPLVIDAEIEDNNDGTYSYNLRTTEEGLFSLYLFYGNVGDSCTLDVTIPAEPNATANVTLGDTASDGCFYGTILNAVDVFPLTSSPTTSPSATPTGSPSQSPVTPTPNPTNAPTASPTSGTPVTKLCSFVLAIAFGAFVL